MSELHPMGSPSPSSSSTASLSFPSSSPAVRWVMSSLARLVARWPSWALWTLLGLGMLCIVTGALPTLLRRFFPRKASSNPTGGRKVGGGITPVSSAAGDAVEVSTETRAKFCRFQAQYLVVYLIVQLADWCQGTNMYTLYQSYGVDVGLLFIAGFSSGAVFGTFLGLYVDRFGRKMGCLVFCVLEIIINTLEHFPDLRLLLLGRILGGVSTSLLFSAFESWMVSAHRSMGFPESWLSLTFSYASMGNGAMAVLAGIIAQVASDVMGDIGPFRVAIALTVVALVLILPWAENYAGSNDSDPLGFAAAVEAIGSVA
eukprot:RCo046323